MLERLAQCAFGNQGEVTISAWYFIRVSDGLFTLELLRGFMTTPERDMAFTSTDHRYASPTLGLSFEVTYVIISSTRPAACCFLLEVS